MTPKIDIRKSKFGQLPILGTLLVTVSLAVILACWGITSIFILTFLISDTGVEKKMTLIPARSSNTRVKFYSDALSKETPQHFLDQRSINSVENDVAFSRLAERVPHDEDVETRVGAIQDLGDIGDPGFVNLDLLIQALNDKSPLVRAAAVDVLGDLVDERTADCLTMAIEDRDAKVRSSVVRALGKVGGDAIMNALGRALYDSNPEVRIAVVEALEILKGEKTIEFLTTALKDTDPKVRKAAEVVLAEKNGWEVDETLDNAGLQKQ